MLSVSHPSWLLQQYTNMTWHSHLKQNIRLATFFLLNKEGKIIRTNSTDVEKNNLH